MGKKESKVQDGQEWGRRGSPRGRRAQKSKVAAGVREGPGERPDAASRQRHLGRELQAENLSFLFPTWVSPSPTTSPRPASQAGALSPHAPWQCSDTGPGIGDHHLSLSLQPRGSRTSILLWLAGRLHFQSPLSSTPPSLLGQPPHSAPSAQILRAVAVSLVGLD